jgi:hypothetical protein
MDVSQQDSMRRRSRVALFMSDTTAASNFGGTSGGALFDAAIKWAAEVITVPRIISVTPTLGPVHDCRNNHGSQLRHYAGIEHAHFQWRRGCSYELGRQEDSCAGTDLFIYGTDSLSPSMAFASNGVDLLGWATSIPTSDGLPDWWEIQYFGNLSQTASGNPDGDSLTNLQEFQQGRNPTKNALADDGNRCELETAHTSRTVSMNGPYLLT